MNDVTGYLSRISGTQVSQTESAGEEGTLPKEEGTDDEGAVQDPEDGNTEAETGVRETETQSKESESTASSKETSGEKAPSEETADARPVIPAVDFELEDQYGNVHKLEEYKGKTIF